MPHANGLSQALLILAAAVGVAVLFRRVRLSPVLGYLLAGALLGPAGFGLVDESAETALLAELGVVFLLFSIGLELSIERMLALRKLVFGLGTLQVVLSAGAVFAGARLLGVPAAPALVLGGALALSSTAVVLRLLEEQRRLGTPPGRVAMAVLLLQDLAVVPLLALVPLLSGEDPNPGTSLALAFGKALLAVAAIVVLGRLALRPVFRVVARARSPEVFTGTTLLVALGIGWLTGLAGLSMALGAFLAGLVIAETEYRHQVEGDVQPFRGLLLALFFVTVGLGLDLGVLVERWATVLGLVAALVAVKAAILALLARAFGVRGGEAVQVGLMLAQGGEFAFVLFGIAAGAGALEGETAAVAGVVVAMSMALTPLLMAAGTRIAGRMGPVPHTPEEIAAEAGAARRHVLIAGFGRVGQTLARVLEEHGTSFVALDLDEERVGVARGRGLPVFFGDASRIEVLRAAGVHHASAIVVTMDEPRAAEHAVSVIRHEVPDLPILVRARDVSHTAALAAAGADAVIPELVEGSLELGGAVLERLGMGRVEAEALLDRFREDSYARLDGLVAHPSHAH